MEEAIFSGREGAGHVIVLLGDGRSGRRRFLLSLGGRDGRTPAFPGQAALCSHQALLQSHLIARENLLLAAAWHGLHDPQRIEDLLHCGRLHGEMAHLRAFHLPRAAVRTLSLLQALLPDPDLLLVDDLAAGLSRPAQQDLWRLLRAEQARRPRTVLYATASLAPARELADEVWWVAGGRVRQRWPAGGLPPLLCAAEAYALSFATPQDARRFQARKLTPHREALGLLACRHDGTSVAVTVDTRNVSLLELVRMAGRGLVRFAVTPVTVDDLPPAWHQQGDLLQTPLPALDRPPQPPATLSPRQRRRAICLVALSEWRRHFRNFWGAGNLLLSAILLLIPLFLLAAVAQENAAAFVRYAPLPLLVPALIFFGQTTGAFSRWLRTGEMDSLMEPARPLAPGRPFSLLALVDAAPAGRGTLLAGIALGQALVFLSHNLLFLLCWGLLLWSLGGARWLWAGTLFFWLLQAGVALVLGLLLGSAVRRPAQGRWLGWAGGVLTALSAVFLPLDFPPFWLWPASGFTAAFHRLPAWGVAAPPFLMALPGTAALAWVAVRRFCHRPAVWQGEDK